MIFGQVFCISFFTQLFTFNFFVYLWGEPKIKIAMSKKVTKEDCVDAINYLWGSGATMQMSSDQQYYTEILLKKVAHYYNIELG